MAAQRGDHVINNNVLKIFKNVIDTYLKSDKFNHLRTTWEDIKERLKGTPVYSAYYNSMSEDDTKFVMYTAVVKSQVATSVNGNDEAYGKEVKILCGACVQYVLYVHLARDGHQDVAQKLPMLERNLKDMVENFIKSDVYIDKKAEEVWLIANPNEKMHYQEVKSRVRDMFRRLIYTGTNGEVIQWAADIEKFIK